MQARLLTLLARDDRVRMAPLIGAVVLVIAGALLLMAGLGFALAAAFLALELVLSPAWAALATAGAAVAAAGIAVGVAGRMQSKASIPDGLELGADLIRRHPLESAAAALVAGIAVGGSEDAKRSLMTALSSAVTRL